MHFPKKIRFFIRKIFELVKIYCSHCLFPTGIEVEKSFVQIMDGTIYHGGLADRFNSIITAYGMAKAIGRDYQLLHTSPFRLENYLVPAAHDWTPRGVTFDLWHVSILRFKKLILKKAIKNNSRKQIHAYVHTNTLASVNAVYGKEYVYGELFNELFKPAEHLQYEIDGHMQNLPPTYEAVVFRFQSLLGDFYEGPFSSYQKGEQEQLINICMDYLKEKKQEKLLVTSDSTTFLNRASQLENVYTIDGQRVHMQYTKGTFESNEKPFVDFYMLTKSRKITLVIAKDMYKSGFPQVASLVGNTEYEIVYL